MPRSMFSRTLKLVTFLLCSVLKINILKWTECSTVTVNFFFLRLVEVRKKFFFSMVD